MNTEKPHLGRTKNWSKRPCGSGLGYLITGEFLDHPHMRGPHCRTSFVVTHDEKTGEVETANSRYRLVDSGEPTRLPGWPWKGDRMRFLGKNGQVHERAAAMMGFEIDKEYEVIDCEVGDWYHTIAFVGVSGRWNGVMFEHCIPEVLEGK